MSTSEPSPERRPRWILEDNSQTGQGPSIVSSTFYRNRPGIHYECELNELSNTHPLPHVDVTPLSSLIAYHTYYTWRSMVLVEVRGDSPARRRPCSLVVEQRLWCVSVRPSPVIPLCTGLLCPQWEGFCYCWEIPSAQRVHTSFRRKPTCLSFCTLCADIHSPRFNCMFNIFLIFYFQVAENKKDHRCNENILQFT